MRVTRLLATAASAVCIAGLAACTTTTDGTGVAASSGSAAAPASGSSTAVDPAQLDPGTYPTSPSPAFGVVTAPDPQIVAAEGQRMAEFVTLPSEIDPEMTDPGLPTGVVLNPQNVGSVFASDAVGEAAGSGGTLAAGFYTSAGQPREKQSDRTRSLSHMVLRYRDPAAAVAAAAAMNKAFITKPGFGGIVHTPVSLPNLPGTLLSQSVGQYPSLNAFTAHGIYVIGTSVVAPPGQEKTLEPAIRKSLALQIPLIDRFPATRSGQNVKARLQLDQNHILIYAIPETGRSAMGGLSQGVYGPRGMASLSGPKVSTVLQENGSEHNAVWKSSVYRATTDAGGQAILKAFGEIDEADGYTRSESPKGLPTAICYTKDTATGQRNECNVAVGRYVGSTYDEDMGKTKQMIAAQYLILTKADQSAN